MKHEFVLEVEGLSEPYIINMELTVFLTENDDCIVNKLVPLNLNSNSFIANKLDEMSN